MKQFVKSMNKDSSQFEYISHTLFGISMEKNKTEVFDYLHIRERLNDQYFITSMNEI